MLVIFLPLSAGQAGLAPKNLAQKKKLSKMFSYFPYPLCWASRQAGRLSAKKFSAKKKLE